MLSQKEYEIIPLPEKQWIVTNTYTQKQTTYNAQIMKNDNGMLIAHSPIFRIELKKSIPGNSKVIEIVPPAFQSAYDQMVAVTEEIQQKLKDGDFIGPSGYSPTVEIKATETGNEVIITDAKGAHTFTVKDGISPTVKTEDTETGVKITVTDAQGDHVFNIEDGFNPTVSVTEIEGGHKITLTDKAGAKEVNVMNGKDGKDGIQGNPGQNATIAIGTVTTLEPDQEATVQNTGTETNAVLSFGIPKGETGATGPQGPQGAPGTNENVLHADISKSENPSVDDAYEAPLQDLKMYGKSTQESTTGKNLFDINDEDQYYAEVLKSHTDTEIVKNYKITPLLKIESLEVGTNYTISYHTVLGDTIDSSQLLYGLSTEYAAYPTGKFLNGVGAGKATYDNVITFEAPAETIYFIGSVENETITQFQIEKGSTATAYEPYTGVQPSPSPDYPQEITKIEEVDCLVTGANLFDKETITDNSYVSDTSGNLMSDSTQTKVASDYINADGLSNIYIADTGQSRWGAFYDSDKAFITGINGYGSKSVPENAKYFRYTIPKTKLDTFTINAGTQALPYEPYQSQHVQFTPPAPLYSLLDGSVADYVDVARGKYVYQLKKAVVTSSNIDSLHDYGSYGYGFYFRFGDKVTGVSNSGICREIKTGIFGDAQALVFSDTAYLYAIHMFESAKTIDEIKQWLDEINGLNIVYQLATLTEQDIPAETLEALQALKTFNGVTNIFCNAPVSAQYEQSVQIVINKILEQLNSLQTQTLSLQEGVLENV